MPGRCNKVYLYYDIAMSSVVQTVRKLLRAPRTLREMAERVDELSAKVDGLRQAIGYVACDQLRCYNSPNIQDYEFKVYSQWGEDGIIQFLIRKLAITTPIFVEFGVEDYHEANTRFLLQHDYWTGLVIDGTPKNVSHIRQDPISRNYTLKAVCAFLDRDNINQVITRHGIHGPIGLLSIDIDGNDYWVWEAIDCIDPAIVICEYNSLFGWQRKVTVPYDRAFDRASAHYSYLYQGASIAALEDLATRKGYRLVGSNRAGNNAFFVTNSISNDVAALTPEKAYARSSFRESRDPEGHPTFLEHDEALNLLSEMPLYDLALGSIIRVKDLRS